MAEWKSVSEPYWISDTLCRIDFEMQNPDRTSNPDRPGFCRYYYTPHVTWDTKSTDGGQMNIHCDKDPILTATTTTWASSGTIVTVELVRTDWVTNVETVIDSITKTIPEPIVCDEDSQRCLDFDLQQCNNNQWETIEQNSESCGYVPPVCTEGDRQCIANDLYECQSNEWVLIESESETCIVPPPPPPPSLLKPIIAASALAGASYLAYKLFIK